MLIFLSLHVIGIACQICNNNDEWKIVTVQSLFDINGRNRLMEKLSM